MRVLVALFLMACASAAAAERVLRHEIEIDAPAEQVWAAWATEAGLESWLASDATVELKPGGMYRLVTGKGEKAAVTELEILSLEPGRMLSYTTSAPAAFPEVRTCGCTWAVIEFEPVTATRSRVRIAALGWREGEQWDAAWAFFEKGNQLVLEMLKSAMEAPGRAPLEVPKFRELVTDLEISAPPADVWELLTTAEGWRALVPVVEADFRFRGTIKTNYNPKAKIGDPGTIVHHVLAYDPGRMYSSRFDVPETAAVAKGAQRTWGVTRISEAVPGKSRLRINMIGWGDDAEADAACDFFKMGNAATGEIINKHFAGKGAAGAQAMALLKSMVGGEWIHEGPPDKDGHRFRTRTAMRQGPSADTVTCDGWLRIGGKEFYHSAAQVWLEPGTGETRFQSLGDNGSVTRGAITVEGGNRLVWDWVSAFPDGQTKRYRVVNTLLGPDRDRLEIGEYQADGTLKGMVDVERERVGGEG